MDIIAPPPKIQVATSKIPDWYYLVEATADDVEGLKTVPGVRLKNGVMQIHRSLVKDNLDFEIVYKDYAKWGTRNRGEVRPVAVEAYDKIARPYQREGADFLLERSGGLIADQVGVGKTMQGLLAAELSGYRPVLVMGTLLSSGPWCGASADPKKFCNLNIVPLIGRKAAGPAIFDMPNDGWFFCHYDILEAWLPWIFTKLRPRVAIFDEVHKLAPRTKRGRAAIAISRFKEMSLRVVISATPVRNRRIDMWMPLELSAPDSMGDYHSFGSRYCAGMHGEYGWKYEGETHNEELKLRMRDMYIRRTKEDVMAYLPAILREGHEVELGMANQEEYAKYKAAERDIRSFLQSFEGKALAPGISGERLIQLGKLLSILSRSKYPATIELATDTAKANGKCVVFCWFKDVARTIATAIAERDVHVYGAITGDDPVKHRIETARKFAEDPEPSVFVATLSSASESINELVACQDMVVNDLYWNPQLMIQAEGRLHRSGQKGSVHVVYVTAKNTIDMDLLNTLHKKALAIETLGIVDDAKSMVGSIGGMAPSDDLDVFIKAVESQILAGGFGIDDEDSIRGDA